MSSFRLSLFIVFILFVSRNVTIDCPKDDDCECTAEEACELKLHLCSIFVLVYENTILFT